MLTLLYNISSADSVFNNVWIKVSIRTHYMQVSKLGHLYS